MSTPAHGRRQSAVAIAYEDAGGAPRVVAKGSGLVAEQIIARAREAQVFVHESRELVALLMNVELDREIPPALYRAIAELLAWLYHIDAARNTGAPLPPPPATLHGSIPESPESPETRKHDGKS